MAPLIDVPYERPGPTHGFLFYARVTRTKTAAWKAAICTGGKRELVSLEVVQPHRLYR